MTTAGARRGPRQSAVDAERFQGGPRPGGALRPPATTQVEGPAGDVAVGGLHATALQPGALLSMQRLAGNRAAIAMLAGQAKSTPVQRKKTTTDTTVLATGADEVAEVKLRIIAVLDGKKPTFKKLQEAYMPALYNQRTAIAADSALMDQVKSTIGVPGWMQVMADLEAQATGGTVKHATAKATDDSVRTQLKEYVGKAVKAGQTARGKVMILEGQNWLDAYYHEFPDELPRGGPTDDEPTTNAFKTNRPPKNLIVLNKDKGNPGTSVHEGVHLYQNNATLNKYGSDLNEAMTEYFTRKVTTPMGIARRNYEDNLVAGEALVNAVGEKVVADAFFLGKTSQLQAALIAFRKGKGDKDYKTAWSRFVSLCRAEDFDDAADLCK